MQTEISDQSLAEIGVILKSLRNIDICHRKSDCIKRRIALRMHITGCGNSAGYCGLLQQSEQELDLLLKMLTIHVSHFFRNPTMFEKLKHDVLPGIFTAAQASGQKNIRIFSLGCAGGEEPYSLAILLQEHFSSQLEHVSIDIIAMDIDSHTLKAAELGEFSEDRLKNISGRLRKNYFMKNASGFTINRKICSMVSFLKADITTNMEHNGADLVLCRNTLIYFTRPAQELIFNRIVDLLSVGGVLVLGKSETLTGTMRTRFEPISMTERIYRKTS